MTYRDAKPILEALRKSLWPVELRATTSADLESFWPGWVARHDATIRARLARGDHDSIVNFLLFGTTFTQRPRATERDIAGLAGRPSRAALIEGRVEDLVAALASPGTNERLQFTRHIVEGKGIDPATATGQDLVRRYLNEGLAHVSAEIWDIDRALQDVQRVNDPRTERLERSTLFRDRGLSSDTSIFPNFVLDQAFTAIRSESLLGADSVRHVAIVGPGLDFTDKRDGYDFYPQQTIQPFAVVDSLIRAGLASADDVRTTTFDLSPRINHHLDTARHRARAGGAYVLQLPRDMDLPWSSGLVEYWKRLGDRIGEEADAIVPPATAGNAHVRAVRVRPAIVRSIIPQDLNIVLQRLEPLPANERFDLIIATDILIYYSVVEQSLALANVAAMLRPGGLFLSNTAVFELPGIPMVSVGYNDALYVLQPEIGDRLVWYRRQ